MDNYESRLIQQRREYMERQKIEKFWHCSKMHGVNEFANPESLEDRFYTEEQESFFAEYEIQMLID